MMDVKTYRELYDVLKEYHNKLNGCAHAGYVPQMCLDFILLQLQKRGLHVVNSEHSYSLSEIEQAFNETSSFDWNGDKIYFDSSDFKEELTTLKKAEK